MASESAAAGDLKAFAGSEEAFAVDLAASAGSEAAFAVDLAASAGSEEAVSGDLKASASAEEVFARHRVASALVEEASAVPRGGRVGRSGGELPRGRALGGRVGVSDGPDIRVVARTVEVSDPAQQEDRPRECTQGQPIARRVTRSTAAPPAGTATNRWR